MQHDSNREARCYCGTTRPSDPDSLAFFQYRGPGSSHATTTCKCGYALEAHDKPHVQKQCAITGKGQTPRGPAPYDSFYCGCRGWD
jgi:hypothetical protein